MHDDNPIFMIQATAFESPNGTDGGAPRRKMTWALSTAQPFFQSSPRSRRCGEADDLLLVHSPGGWEGKFTKFCGSHVLPYLGCNSEVHFG
jgi:hypothetical protein